MADNLPPWGDPSEPTLEASVETFPKQYPRVLITNLLPHVSRTVLKKHFKGCQGGKLRILDIELFSTGKTCSAIVTFSDTGGVQAILKAQNESLKLAGQQLQLSPLCTESTTLTISDLEPDLHEKVNVFELAKRWNVVCKWEGSQLSLTGPIDLVHHVRVELDVHILQAYTDSTAHILPANMTPAPYPSPPQLSPPPGAELPPSSDSHPPTTSDSPHVFSNLSPDILALLAKVPEGDLPGVQYLPKDGEVRFESRSKEELEDHISKFQMAYQGILGARRLKVEPVEVPPALDDEKVTQTVASFNEQYNQCVFVYYKDPQVIKVVSTSSRQFDQAKKMLVESLASRPASNVSAKVKFSLREEVIALPGGRKLTLKKANIVEEKVDIIVNAANSRLLHGGGVAGAINSASHGEVQKYSDRYISQKGSVPVGQVAYTNAGGNLKCKLVYHAVGPDSSYTTPECERLLIRVINATMTAAERANHNSIAIPALSSGIFGVDKEVVARCIIDTILNFRFTKAPPVLSDIRIVIIDNSTYSCFAQYFVQRRALLTQALSKPSEPLESQSAGIGHWGHGNTEFFSTSEPLPFEERNPTPSVPTSPPPSQPVSAKGTMMPVSESNAIPDSSQPGGPSGGGKALALDDLGRLAIMLNRAASKWHALGLELGLSQDVLAVIPQSEVHYDDAVYLNKMLTTWLTRQGPPPTLDSLSRALCQPSVGEEKLAVELLQAVANPPDANDISKLSWPTMLLSEGEDGSSTSPHPGDQPPTPSYPSGHGQPSTKPQGTGETNSSAGLPTPLIPPIPMTVAPTQPSEVAEGTDPLSSLVGPGHPSGLQRSMSDPSSSTLRVLSTAVTTTTDTMNTTYSQAVAGGGGSGGGGCGGDRDGGGGRYSVGSGGGRDSVGMAGGRDGVGGGGGRDGIGSGGGRDGVGGGGGRDGVGGGGGRDGVGGGGVPTAITSQPRGNQKHHVKNGQHKGTGGGTGGGSKSHYSHHNKGDHGKDPGATAAGKEKNCPICLDGFKNPTRTKCGHQFCFACLSEALKYEPYCPTCKHVLRPIVGKQPRGGQMTHRVLYGQALPGYRGYNAIEISYYIPDGIQGQEHPNPGHRFTGTSRTAYLPDNHEGREVLKLLRKAFDARLTFTVGTSVTTGFQNTVVWNDIHHKTNMYGGAQAYGYPDPTYLQRVKEDLAAKGIVPDAKSSIV